MRIVLAAVLALCLIPSLAFAQVPAAAAGKTLWLGEKIQCRNCHGKEGQGAFGPILAGRGLTAAQIRAAVRTPSGIMPAFNDVQLSDADIRNLAAYFASLPPRSTPGPWAYTATASMPEGQQLLINEGCAQCHGPAFHGPRGTMGGVNMDFPLFKKLVYAHFVTYPQIYKELRAGNPPEPPLPPGAPPRVIRMHVMGNFNPSRLPEAKLRKIYDWVRDDLGFLPLLDAQLSVPQTGPGGATYTLSLFNGGLKNKSLPLEGLTVDLALPAGVTVVRATGDGYRGVHQDASAKANVAEWVVPALAAKETKSFTITLSKPGTAKDNLKGTIHWAKPGPKNGPNLDVEAIAPAPTAAPG